MFSNRGTSILQFAAGLPAALDEKNQVAPKTPGQVSIDLTMVENWLPRPDFLEIGKKAIAEKFEAAVSLYPVPTQESIDLTVMSGLIKPPRFWR